MESKTEGPVGLFDMSHVKLEMSLVSIGLVHLAVDLKDLDQLEVAGGTDLYVFCSIVFLLLENSLKKNVEECINYVFKECLQQLK